ncbi:hypothetical protein MUK42_22708 [Musa troglodytarum]|uniref:Uncharacterized protein n=1 Tax=Musa troglodytarum TaxID=320322 RepID=A0A9E7G0A3_9LILI|nr:hypothetical protein MUK42_22708 [Musa troglodytarum]
MGGNPPVDEAPTGAFTRIVKQDGRQLSYKICAATCVIRCPRRHTTRTMEGTTPRRLGVPSDQTASAAEPSDSWGQPVSNSVSPSAPSVSLPLLAGSGFVPRRALFQAPRLDILTGLCLPEPRFRVFPRSPWIARSFSDPAPVQCLLSTRPLWRCHCSSHLWARALRYRCSGRACVESVFRVMPLTRFSSDAFGVVTISLVILFHVLAIRCIYQVVYLQVRIHRRDFLQLGFFNGPWITRIFLVIVAIWWSLSEIARLSFLKGRLFSSITWQQNFCKLYILFNLGFSEPSVFLTLVFLLRASLRRRELGTLSQGWNKRTISYVFLYCIPIFVMQVFLDFAGPKFFSEAKNGGRAKKLNYFTKASVLIGDECVCTYPLFSTILLGLFHAALISYVSYIGMHVFLSVINKRLLQRLYWLVSSVIFSLPVRVLLLGFSVLPQPGNLAYELIVFLAFLVMLFCTVIGILVLVYFPAADLMALRNLEEREVEGIPYDDYFNDSASLVANQSRHDTRRSSDVSTMRGSISFRTMIRDDTPDLDISDETNLSFHGALHIGSPSVSSSTPARPMLPLRESSIMIRGLS